MHRTQVRSFDRPREDGFLHRHDSSMPYQTWSPFPPEAIVLVKNLYGDRRIGLAKDFWWGYELEMGDLGEGVIVKARRLDRPRARSSNWNRNPDSQSG